ncbi:uncharacterized protein EDB91DRAFT_1247346 [Suillus paluster]|uniref:uncharacterized protein n=1 Tax=Suillus paluster TaxID=48578 RepID=UPI001B875572|nr:uncharacterized protein EDB91DRAFT_1247346 [Suillus paluster]KAG1743265.1 hypothetical protein EDB91DRAFT_1247346 [Suillus paluster]
MWHSWRSKAITWQALGDPLFDLAHEVDGGASNNAPSPSTSMDGDALEKGKGKAREVDPEPAREKPREQEVEGSMDVKATPEVGNKDSEEGDIEAGTEIEGVQVSPAQLPRPSRPPRSHGLLKKAPFGPGMTPPLMCPDVLKLSEVTSVL